MHCHFVRLVIGNWLIVSYRLSVTDTDRTKVLTVTVSKHPLPLPTNLWRYLGRIVIITVCYQDISYKQSLRI